MQPLTHQVDVITYRDPCARCRALAIEAHMAACHGRARLAARLEKTAKIQPAINTQGIFRLRHRYLSVCCRYNATMANGTLYKLASFSTGDEGGNPAGVWIGEELPSPASMQEIAADVGASETAFIAPAAGRRRVVRYYSPEVEVSFCGHATIASGIVLGREEGEGVYEFDTSIGTVVVTAWIQDGQVVASLRSVDTRHEAIDDPDLQEILECLHWDDDILDLAIPPVKAFAGAWHLVIATHSADLLAGLDYDFDRLKDVMQRLDLTTLQLIYREREDLFQSRNPFPIGGIFEDPATGAAAAALGGYLRDAGFNSAPFTFRVMQGVTMGMPSLINVEVPEVGGIIVSGTGRDL